jgi:hypothetical protein
LAAVGCELSVATRARRRLRPDRLAQKSSKLIPDSNVAGREGSDRLATRASVDSRGNTDET